MQTQSPVSRSHALLTKPPTPTSSIRGFVSVRQRHTAAAFAPDGQQSLFTHHKTTGGPHLVKASIGHFLKDDQCYQLSGKDNPNLCRF